MKQLLIFIRKEFFHVFRDQKTLLLLFGTPIAQILLFGFALTNEIKNAQIIVVDNAKDAASQAIIEKLEHSSTFTILKSLESADQIHLEFQYGKANLALVFPENLYQSLHQNKQAQIQIIADASDPNTASTLSNYATNSILEYQFQLNEIERIPYAISTEVRMIYNPELKGTTNFVPGVMALVLLLVCVLMTSVSIVREKELGTLEILLVSPFNPIMVVVAKAIPYFVLSLVNLSIILLLSTTLMGMPIKGSLLLLYLASSIFILTALSLGLLISNTTNSQQSAMLFSLMGMLIPALMFTGFMFPIENMPWPLQIISNILPSKWYYIIAKAIMIKGLGLSSIWKEMLILTSMTTVLLVVGIKKFKVRLA